MTHHTKPVPLMGTDLETSSPPAARGNAAAQYRARKSLPSAQTRLAVSLAIALRYRADRARMGAPAATSTDA